MLSNLQISRPTIYLSGFFFVAQIINGFNDARNSYSVISNYWYALAFFWAVSWWFMTDSRQHGTGWANGIMDMGMLLL